MAYLKTTRRSGPSFTHEDVRIAFSDTLRKWLQDASMIDSGERVLCTDEGGSKLHGPTKGYIPDSIITVRRGHHSFRFFWVEVCFSESANHVFKKLADMVENGLYPIAGIFVIFAHEMPRTSSTLPRKPLPDFLTKGVGCQTFQEEEIVAPFDEHNLPENVFLAGTHPHPFNPSAVRHWSQNACPPRAYSGMKVHGRVNLTLFFITPPRFQRLLEPCAKPEERFQWAKERYLYTTFYLGQSLGTKHMTVNDEFWEAMGLQLMAYKRVLNRLLHTEVPEDILQGARSGSSYFQDGHFNWVREQFSNYTDDSFVTLQDEDVTRWWQDCQDRILTKQKISQFHTDLICYLTHSLNAWGKLRMKERVRNAPNSQQQLRHAPSSISSPLPGSSREAQPSAPAGGSSGAGPIRKQRTKQH